jgi:mediator of RNA polymerase II transcription subunit 12
MTLNDTRRLAWLADLSNPSVPLSKLSRTVLHVAKGPDLLDMLHAQGVAIPRAVWYVRILGANETVRTAFSLVFVCSGTNARG